MPVTKFHSTMLRPDSLKRVKPPTTRIPKTKAEQPNSHLGRLRGIVRSRGAVVERDLNEIEFRIGDSLWKDAGLNGSWDGRSKRWRAKG